MTHQVVFAEAAEQDIADQLAHLVSAAGAVVAHRFVDRILDYCLGFETFPERGTRRDDLSPGLRTFGYRRQATIAFRVQDNTVTIARVLFAGRSLVLADSTAKMLDETE